MNLFDFALKMELDGEKYYREIAAKVKYDDLKKVLEDLADDEKRHYEIVQSIKNQTAKFIEAGTSLSKVQHVFESKELVSENKEFIAKLKDEQIDIYRAALEKEKESVELYKKITKDLEETAEKAICEKLMHEEEKHVELIDHIIEMINRSNDWVEAAEFNHQDSY